MCPIMSYLSEKGKREKGLCNSFLLFVFFYLLMLCFNAQVDHQACALCPIIILLALFKFIVTPSCNWLIGEDKELRNMYVVGCKFCSVAFCANTRTRKFTYVVIASGLNVVIIVVKISFTWSA